MKPGDKLEVDCVNYVCDGQAKSMVPVEKGTVELFNAKIFLGPLTLNYNVDIFFDFFNNSYRHPCSSLSFYLSNKLLIILQYYGILNDKSFLTW